MITDAQLSFLKQHGFQKSNLVLSDGVYWIFNDTHSITVKETEYNLFLSGNAYKLKDMVHLATIIVELPLEDFIVLMNAFHFVEIK